MNCIGSTCTFRLGTILVGAMATLLLAVTLSHSAAVPGKQPLSEQEMLRLGERMYREGVLPSGEAMEAYVMWDTPAPGTSFTCVSCHMLSGLGSVEGGVFTPPTNGPTLYQPRDLPGIGNNRRNAGMTMTGERKKDPPTIRALPARPAYNDQTLADLLRGGRDPSGRIIDMIMPRYRLEDSDMAAMVSYLKSLSAEYSPGVTKDAITFATVIVEGVPADRVAAMMEPLESFVKSANSQQQQFEAQRAKLREKPLDPTYRRVRLARWLLKGEPATWSGQLEEYYRKEPVFALIAGISPGEWEPVHRFCEANRLPALLPITDYPVVSADNRYTLYFSRGYFQEGEAAARYLLSRDTSLAGKKIVQLVDGSLRGQLLADGFARTLVSREIPAPLTITLAAGSRAEDIGKILDREHADILALWTGADTLRLAAAHAGDRPPLPVFLASAGMLGNDLWTVPDAVRSGTLITYPYRLPQDEARFARIFQAGGKTEPLSDDIRLVKGKTLAALRVLTQSLREMKGNFYRDYFLDVIGMQKDIQLPLYERLSFGPDQRYASKGCFIVRLSGGDRPELVKMSDWVIH